MKYGKSSFKRKISSNKFSRKFIIFVEGEKTEVSYLNLLKKNNCKVEPIAKKGHGISHCMDFVVDSIKSFNCLPLNKREEYTQKWLVFDNDGRDDFAKAIKKARENGFRVAFSNMCIEYWFVLHFVDHDGSLIPMEERSHSKAQINILNSEIKKYNKRVNEDMKIALYDSKSKQLNDDLYDLMLAINPKTSKRRIIDAFERAQKIHLLKQGNGAEFMESVTTIYELLRELGVIEKKGEEYQLYTYN